MQPQSYLPALLQQLRPVPVPEGSSSREIVRRAIEFEDPPRIPYYFLFHPSASDIVIVAPREASPEGPREARGAAIGRTYVDRWGVKYETTGRAFGRAIEHPLADLAKVKDYRVPNLTASLRWVERLLPLAEWGRKYVVGYNPVQMVETMRSLMGFEALMLAPKDQPDGLHALLERLTEKTIDVVRHYGATGRIHGFLTAEDWGLQTSLQMNVDTFREHFAPYYSRIIDACHEQRMHFMWHNCGWIVDMLPDMIDLGVDVVQLDQPRLMGHQNLIDGIGGKICMWNTVDIQWSTTVGTRDEDIRNEVIEMLRAYDVRRRGGGFIAKHYPQPWDIELTAERQRLIYETFLANGCGEATQA